jgi:hypothetical protein
MFASGRVPSKLLLKLKRVHGVIYKKEVPAKFAGTHGLFAGMHTG